MKLKKLIDPSPIHPIQMGWFILLQLLLLFDDQFSKFHLFGPVHLYDALFILLSIAAGFVIIREKRFWLNRPLLILIGISIAYLLFSFLVGGRPLNFVVRQYAVMVYLIGSMLMAISFLDEEKLGFNVRFMAMIGVAALGIQIIYLGYLSIFEDSFAFFGRFNYFSKMGTFALICSGAYFLVFVSGWRKWVSVALYFAICATLGHASAILSAMAIIFVYLLFRSQRLMKVAVIGIFLMAVAGMIIFLPSFSDNNAIWRVVYWQYTLRDLVLDNYVLLGNGFGVPYVSQELIKIFESSMVESSWFIYRPEEKYLTPMHNSFITIAYYIGIAPTALLAVPLIKPFRYFLTERRSKQSHVKDFLILALVGGIVWSSFNVILELPHSSSYFWLIYFSLIFAFHKRI